MTKRQRRNIEHMINNSRPSSMFWLLELSGFDIVRVSNFELRIYIQVGV